MIPTWTNMFAKWRNRQSQDRRIMSSYICSHGELFARCYICSEINKAMEDYLKDEEWNAEREYLYDYYLHLDEREMRQKEEN
jgi:hypothetical protein